MKKWQVIQLNNGLGEHAPAWDAINRLHFKNNPMLDSRFVGNLIKYFAIDPVYLCASESENSPASMCLLTKIKPGIWASFLPSQAQIGPSLLHPSSPMESLMHSLPGYVLRLDLLCIDPQMSSIPASLSATPSRHKHALTMSIGATQSFDIYWATRSKNLVKNLARYERRLKTDDIVVRFSIASTSIEINDGISRYASLEAKGWKGALGTAVSYNNQANFYSDLLQAFTKSNSAFVYELWFDDELVASRLVVKNESIFVILKTTYNESYEKYAPGKLLLFRLIRSIHQFYPTWGIEFYTDANPDQLTWATQDRWIKHVSYFRNSFAKQALGFTRFLRRGLSSDVAANKSPSVRALTVEAFKHPDAFPADVKHLFNHAEKESIEFGGDWFANLIDTVYPHDDGVHIYVLRKNGKPIAALPIRIVRTWQGAQIEALGNYYTALFSPIMEKGVKADELAFFIKDIEKKSGRLWMWRFAPLASESPNYSILLEALETAGNVCFRFFSFGNWYLKVQEEWGVYLKNRSGTLRSTIKRMSKKLATDNGSLTLVVGQSDLETGLAAYQAVYAKSWKVPEPFPKFVPGLIHKCASRGWLRLGLAWMNGQPIAAQLWIVANQKAMIYKVAYNEDFKAFAPGTLLTAMLMEHVIDKDRVTEVDYLIGDDPYKKTWMSHRRERWGLVAYNPMSLKGLIGLLREVLGRYYRVFARRFRRELDTQPSKTFPTL